MGDPTQAEPSRAAPGGTWRSDRIAGAGLALFAAVVAWQTRTLPIGTLSNPGPGYMPLVLAAVLAALGLLVAWRGGESIALRDLRWPELGHAVKILGSCAFAAAAFEPLGFRLTVLAVSIFLIGVIERRPPLAVALVSFALSFGTFYLFNDLLKTPLPVGVLGI
ncbi:MAG TPA: tripartite tricarboxylate transporter TctB family protein [Alphaproteobacteria bacterium]